MRAILASLVLAGLALVPSVQAQQIITRDPSIGGKEWPGSEKGIAGYRVIRKGGKTVEVRRVVEKSPWYHLTDFTGKSTSQLMASVDRVEPIYQAEVDKIAADEEKFRQFQAEESQRKVREERALADARLAGRLEEARDQGRQEARMQANTSVSTSYRSSYSGGSSTHVGPRGGVYHYSASGKKVYHKK